MESDDDFGDLYSDVLRPFASQLSSSSTLERSMDPYPKRPSRNDAVLHQSPAAVNQPSKTLALSLSPKKKSQSPEPLPQYRVSGPSSVDGLRAAAGGNAKDSTLMRCDGEDVDERPVIPGLSDSSGAGKSGAGGDWDSDNDSEDDLQIVLNDSNNNGNIHGNMVSSYRGEGVQDDDDDDGDPLVIVADDGDANQVLGEQEWGDEVADVGNDEKKEVEGKANGGAGATAGAPSGGKVVFSGMGYHPFHSQFKYMRPGASPMPGSNATNPIGAPGQARSPLNMGSAPGRGRGDWRLTGMRNASGLQKGFPSGFGMLPWGSGRGHAGGLEFTLPSHKPIFEVDIDNFEEKPWRYQGVDVTDFFNFGLNEESWKDYCKQLEQHRMETTMQSKIHVYNSGRTEQGFDPDLPPELAAATGVRDYSTENAINGKLDAGQNDLRAPVCMRPALPAGRPIQVENGFGERLPSIDTRPPRIRDSDAIIEIVCQDSANDNPSASGVPECPDNCNADSILEAPEFPEYLGGQRIAVDSILEKELRNTIATSEALTNLERGDPRRSLTRGDIQNETSEREEDLPLSHGGSLHQRRVPSKHIKDANDAIVERRLQEDSLQMSPSHNAENNESLEGHAEQTNDIVDNYGGAGMEIPMERNHTLKGEPSTSEKSSILETEQIASDSRETLEKRKSGRESPNSKAVQELEGVEDAGPTRSSENSKARSSSRETYKWRDDADEEVVRASISTRRVPRGIPDGHEPDSRRRDLGRRQEREGSHMSVKARMDPHRDWDSGSVHSLPIERQNERDYSDGAWRRREDEFSSERPRFEDSRKRDRGDELWSKDRIRGRENERGDKVHLPSKRQLDNGIYKVNYEKESAMRRERDESLGSRYETMDDNHRKRKRVGYFVGRESDKEEILRQSRENISRRERERDISIGQMQREERHRSRKGLEENHSSRLKDGSALPREKNDLSRDREERRKEWQNHDGHFTKGEREYDRAGLRAERMIEEKPWNSQERTRDNHKAPEEYHHRDAGHQSDLARKSERVEEKSPHRQFSTEDRRTRQEKTSRDLVSDSSVMHNRKHREGYRKNKDSESGDHLSSRRSQDDRTNKANNMGMTGPAERQSKEPAVSEQILSSRENREERVTYEDEQSDSRRGRSKLESWTSHNERDYDIKPSSSSRFKQATRNMKSASSEADKLLEPAKTPDTADQVHLLAERKDVGDAEKKDVEVQPSDNKHLDAADKLKKRSERFKLPMPSEKEVPSIKKVENEPLSSSKTETAADSEIKPERPARKRRWVSN